MKLLRSACFFRFVLVSLFVPPASYCAFGQGGEAPTCPVVAEHELSPAEAEYAQGRYARADDLFGQALTTHPGDPALTQGFIHTLLHENEVERAATLVNKRVAAEPRSAAALTDLAELQLHQGEPWLALETLKGALEADPCSARAHLIRGRALRIDSMYGTERAEIEKAYAIDPTDPDVKHAWLSVVSPAKEIEGIAGSLETMKDLDAETRTKAQGSIDEMMPNLTEYSETCKVLPSTAEVTLPLMATMLDAKHIDGYKLEVQLPKTGAKLQVDTGASGLYISRALADMNGLTAGAGDPAGTVHVDHLKIGPLEFGDCMVGVSETPFAGKSDGFVGTDLFSPYLITLDQPRAKLTLAPLPKIGLLPGDRWKGDAVPAELKGFMPVYHRQQYLLVPAMLDGKARRLFILDTGIRFSTMRSDVAHLVSTTKMNFTNSVQTVSGSTLQVYRDSFDFQLANLALNHQSHILEMDTAAIDQNAGMQIAGMLGFDMLHSFVMQLDYRDGLVKLESQDAGVTSGQAGGGLLARGGDAEECVAGNTEDRPMSSTFEAKVNGTLDSTRLKPGKEIMVTVINGWQDDECNLQRGAVLYGHVTASSSGAGPDASEFSIAFDHGDCYGTGKKALSFRMIGLIAPADQYVGLHSVLPSQVSGGGRSISNLAADTSFPTDENLNPGQAPHTIRPGTVLGMPKVKLEPLGGPGCSARLTSSEKSIRLGTGAVVILTRQKAH